MKKKLLAIIILSLYALSLFSFSASAYIVDEEGAFTDGKFVTEEHIYIVPASEYTGSSPVGSGIVASKDGTELEIGEYIATGDVVINKGKVVYTFVCPGDLNCDGLISSEDARISLRLAVGLESVDSFEMKLAADVFYSFTFDSADARYILLYAVGNMSMRDFYYANRIRHYQKYQERYFSVMLSDEKKPENPGDYTPEYFNGELLRAVYYNRIDGSFTLVLKEAGRDNMDRLIFSLMEKEGLSFVLPGRPAFIITT